MVTADGLHPPEVIAELKKNQEAYDEVKERMEVQSIGAGRSCSMVAPSWPSTTTRGTPTISAARSSGLGRFSLHRVGERPVDLGFHAVSSETRDLDVPSFEQQIADNRVIIDVALSRGAGEPTLQFGALLDTGAQVTAISPKVVQGLQLVPTASSEPNRGFGPTGQHVSISSQGRHPDSVQRDSSLWTSTLPHG